MRHLNRRHQIGRTEHKEQYKMRKQIKPKEVFKNLYLLNHHNIHDNF